MTVTFKLEYNKIFILKLSHRLTWTQFSLVKAQAGTDCTHCTPYPQQRQSRREIKVTPDDAVALQPIKYRNESHDDILLVPVQERPSASLTPSWGSHCWLLGPVSPTPWPV